ncbi:MAG: vWA domain-containing protein [Verrucomicrobiales bacterium]
MKKSMHLNGRSALTLAGAPAEIAVILDRSASMASIAGDAIGGFNSFVAAQCLEPGEGRLTLILFDNEYEVPIKSLPLAEVPPLTDRTFVPRGSTALFDAIGRTIKKMTASFAGRPQARRPTNIIVAILTDGFENASRHYTQAHIADLITEKRAQGWQFIFLAANQDAIASAAKINIAPADAVTFEANAAGACAVFEDLSVMTAERRRRPQQKSIT